MTVENILGVVMIATAVYGLLSIGVIVLFLKDWT